MKTHWIVIVLAVVLFASACGPAPAQEQEPEGTVEMSLELTSSAFSEGGAIPSKYTCDGQDVSPDLAWQGAPAGVQSYALISDDPDAPVGTWVHWVLFDLPAEQTGLPEGAQGVGVDGTNSFRKRGYGGPCPPAGKPHRYFFKLYALDQKLELEAGASKAELERAMQGHILAQGQLIGVYGR